jgi:hypothetical protein
MGWVVVVVGLLFLVQDVSRMLKHWQIERAMTTLELGRAIGIVADVLVMLS